MSNVSTRAEGRLGTITLDRPQAINALNTPMVRAITAALQRWESEEAVETVLIEGGGERGLCAGGDIVMFRSSALAGDGQAREFWSEEYALDARIAAYPKPVVVFMDGIVMGGGVGLCGHASHRVATERLLWSMPEVGIGFCPDVGGPFLLARAPGELGLHLALSAARIGAGDAIACGFADVCVDSSRLDALREELRSTDPETAIAHALAQSAPPPAASLLAQREILDPAYAGPSAAAIVAALEADGREPASAAAAAIRQQSPTAQEVTLRAIRRASRLQSLEQCLAQDLQTSTAFMGVPDFVEGIRALVVDKDREPRWSPSRLEDVSEEDLSAFSHLSAPPTGRNI
ncbi:MAG: enoyl-CoA hydratase/isomerase family protein [Solirubrobacterales bacterium]